MPHDDPWYVIATTCYPCSWKIVPRHTYREDNRHFYELRADAQRIADAWNKKHRERFEEPVCVTYTSTETATARCRR